MILKIAFKNVQKSIKDYGIYFLTLVVATGIFYSFNSISSQSAMEGINNGTAEYLKVIGSVIGYLSIFISVVLAFLILYANNFIIKRRKREFGVYMTLGMGRNAISKILVMEELVIGVVSLVVGLIFGVICSQGLSVLTLKLFNLPLEKLKFVISPDAIFKTIIYFAIIYVLVIIFNSFNIRRYRLINLLNSHKKNEKIKFRNPIVSIVVFIVSLILIGEAYHLALKVGLDFKNLGFKISILLGIVGTVLFFYGIVSFLMIFMEKTKLYFKGLNIFTVRQVGNKINTNFITMAVVCLMLFFTISLLSVSIAFKNRNYDTTTPFNASILNMGNNIDKTLKYSNFKMPSGALENTLNITTLNKNFTEVLENQDLKDMPKYPPYILDIKQYNKNLELLGKKPIELNDNQVYVLSSQLTKDSIDKYILENGTFKIEGETLKSVTKKSVDEPYMTDSTGIGGICLVVPNNLFKKIESKSKYNRQVMNVIYNKDNIKENEDYFMNYSKYANKTLSKNNEEVSKDNFVLVNTKINIKEEMSASTTMILYIAIYLGSIFLIASGAILALQQLSEANNSFDRYNSLRRIGASKKSINKSIFRQTSIYFMLPIGLGVIHSIVAIDLANTFIQSFGRGSIIKPAIVTIIVILIIYMLYFVLTYISYKNIVKKK